MKTKNGARSVHIRNRDAVAYLEDYCDKHDLKLYQAAEEIFLRFMRAEELGVADPEEDPETIGTGLYLGRIGDMFINYAQKVTFNADEIRNAGFLMYAFNRDEIEDAAAKHGFDKFEIVLRRKQ